MKKIVVYTAIFGGYDDLYEPLVKPDNVDFVCFTDNKNLKSDVWDVRYTLPLYYNYGLKNPFVRNARKFKALPHRFLSDYDYSVWADGNALCRGDVNTLVTQYLIDSNMAVYDKMYCILDPWNCIYEERNRIFFFGNRNLKLAPWKGIKAFKDDPKLIEEQCIKYQNEGFPAGIGLLSAMVLVRRHNETDVVSMGEKWWEEMKYHSHLDQMSFNYVAWKKSFKFNWIKEDVRECTHFKHMGIHKSKRGEK
tara:strand:- start:1120 stop:1869 length:750 start_codon:yes stop_codon:yes gene_type:complete